MIDPKHSRNPAARIGLLLAILWAAGCGSDESSDSGLGLVQIVNGIVDSPDLLIEIEEDGDLAETVNALGFQRASRLTSLSRALYEFDIFFEDPEDGFNERLLSSELEVRRNTVYLGVLSGSFSNPLLTWYERPEGTVTDADSEDIELLAINLSSESVAVYLGDDSDGLAAESLVATLAPGSVSSPLLVAHDDDADYRARVTLDGSDTIVYDSDRITIPVGSRQTLLVTDPTGPDPDTKSLVILSDSSAIAYGNVAAGSGFRMINALADAADIRTEVVLSAAGTSVTGQTLLFGEATALIAADATFIDVDTFAPAAAATASTTTVSLSSDTAYVIVTAGTVLEEDVSVRATELDLRSVANSVNIHLINALNETDDEDISAVDFYALPLGDSLADTAPAATNVGFLEGRNTLLPATAYDLVVTTAGTQSILAGPARVFPSGGERVLSVAAESAGGGLPNQILTLIDTSGD
ncbi:MAG: hypothetical protein AAGG11_05470 [Pseudomonadota bacterium]